MQTHEWLYYISFAYRDLCAGCYCYFRKIQKSGDRVSYSCAFLGLYHFDVMVFSQIKFQPFQSL